MHLVFSGCPGAKKNEFLTSVLDALSTDMVHAVSDPSASSRYVASDHRAGRWEEAPVTGGKLISWMSEPRSALCTGQGVQGRGPGPRQEGASWV